MECRSHSESIIIKSWIHLRSFASYLPPQIQKLGFVGVGAFWDRNHLSFGETLKIKKVKFFTMNCPRNITRWSLKNLFLHTYEAIRTIFLEFRRFSFFDLQSRHGFRLKKVSGISVLWEYTMICTALIHNQCRRSHGEIQYTIARDWT